MNFRERSEIENEVSLGGGEKGPYKVKESE